MSFGSGNIRKSFFLENIRSFFRVFVCQSIRNSLILQLERSIPSEFFKKDFFESLLKSALCSSLQNDASLIFLQCSEYAFGSKYVSSSKFARVLNIPFPKYNKVPFPENISNFFRSGIYRKKFRKFSYAPGSPYIYY